MPVPVPVGVAVVLVLLALGVREEVHIGGEVAAAGLDVVHVEVLDREGGLEALVQLGAPVLRHQRQQVVVRAAVDGRVGSCDDRVDGRAGGLDAGEPDPLRHPVQPHQRLQEQPVSELCGLGSEGAHPQRLVEDVAQLGLTTGGDPLERVVDVAGGQRPASVGDGRTLGGVAVGLHDGRPECGQQGDDPVDDHGVLLRSGSTHVRKVPVARP